MTQTPRHGLPLLAAGQAQKEVTHNEALLAIDCRLHSAFETRSLSAPPAAPRAGAMYLVGGDPDGDWAGKAGMIANWDGFGWRFTSPANGWLAWIADEGVFVVYNDGWSTGVWPANGLRIGGRDVLAAPMAAVAGPAGGAVVDVECRAAVETLLSALRNQGIVL